MVSMCKYSNCSTIVGCEEKLLKSVYLSSPAELIRKFLIGSNGFCLGLLNLFAWTVCTDIVAHVELLLVFAKGQDCSHKFQP